jgi:hypothetical protein
MTLVNCNLPVSSGYFEKEYDNELNMTELTTSYDANILLHDKLKIIENQDLLVSDEDILMNTHKFSLSMNNNRNKDVKSTSKQISTSRYGNTDNIGNNSNKDNNSKCNKGYKGNNSNLYDTIIPNHKLSKKEKKRKRKAKNKLKKELNFQKKQELEYYFFDNIIDNIETDYINNIDLNIKHTSSSDDVNDIVPRTPISDNNSNKYINTIDTVSRHNKLQELNYNKKAILDLINDSDTKDCFYITNSNNMDTNTKTTNNTKTTKNIKNNTTNSNSTSTKNILDNIKINTDNDNISLSDVILKIQGLNGSLPLINNDYNKKKIRQEVWVEHNGTAFESICYIDWCTNIINVFNYQVGHDIPKSKGGPNNLNNLKPICESCNQSMGNKYTIKEWNKLFTVPNNKKELLITYNHNTNNPFTKNNISTSSNTKLKLINNNSSNIDNSSPSLSIDNNIPNDDILNIRKQLETALNLEKENKLKLAYINNYCKVLLFSALSACVTLPTLYLYYHIN